MEHEAPMHLTENYFPHAGRLTNLKGSVQSQPHGICMSTHVKPQEKTWQACWLTILPSHRYITKVVNG